MKLRLSRQPFILALAFLVGAAMTPCVVHAQNQSSPSTSTTSKAKSTASKQAKQTTNGVTDTGNKAAAKTEGAASSAKDATTKAATSTKNAATNGANSAKNGITNGASSAKNAGGAAAASATPPSPGMVWVNTNSKMYHKSGSQYYGKTKTGKWMTEADAQKAGFKPAKN